MTQPPDPLSNHTTPGWHRFFRFFIRLWLYSVARVEVEGLENVPREGAVVGVANHLSSYDTLVTLATSPVRRLTFFGAIEHRSDFIAGWVMKKLRTIWVRRGEGDREAIQLALQELKGGTLLCLAMEGTRSKTGALQPGKTGPAYLATRANAPLLPIVLWGTEKIVPNLKRLRRTTVHVRVDPIFQLPSGRANSVALDHYTEQIMIKLASMLPAEYRGVYADRINNAQSTNSHR